MLNIGYLPWDYLLEHNPTPFTPVEASIWLLATFVPSDRPSRLRAKHLIMGMYYTGSQQVRGTPKNYRPSSTTLSVAGSDIGILKIRPKPVGVADAGALALASGNGNANANAIANRLNGTGRLGEIINPARRGDLFDVRDPDNPEFRVFGAFTGEYVEVEALFTASQSVIAQAAIAPFMSKVRGGISGTSDPQALYSPAYIDVSQSEQLYHLTYGQISQTIACLWRMFIAEQKYGGLELVVEYNFDRIGRGIVRNGKSFGGTEVAR